MFDLDLRLFNLIYNQCKNLGNAFYLGAFEGFIIYASANLYAITTVTSKKDVKK